MSEEGLEAYFREEAVIETLLARVSRSGAPPAGTFGSEDELNLELIAKSPRMREMLDRVFQRVRPRPMVGPPQRDRPRFD
jgi:hypothetical protein